MAEQTTTAPIRSPLTEIRSVGNLHMALPYFPRGGPKTPPIGRRIKELQQQDWGSAKSLRLQPHRHRLEIEKERAAQKHAEEIVHKLVTRILQQACSRYGQAYATKATCVNGSISARHPVAAAQVLAPVSHDIGEESDGGDWAKKPLELKVHLSRLEREKLAYQRACNSDPGQQAAAPRCDGVATDLPLVEDVGQIVRALAERAIAAVLRLQTRTGLRPCVQSHLQPKQDLHTSGRPTASDRQGAAARHASIWQSIAPLGDNIKRPLSRLEQEQAMWREAMGEASCVMSAAVSKRSGAK
eukprot:jgi/Ulvmu1/9206/UM005_0306.1